MKKINIIEKLYLALSHSLDIINEKVFDDEFDNIVFLIQGERATALNTYGVFWPERWTIDEKKYSEISITAEWLQTRNYNDILLTIVHELVHYKAKIEGIKDTSANGNFHNKNFKSLGEQYGLIFKEKDKKHGWSRSEPDDFLLEIFKVCAKETNLEKVLIDAKRDRNTPKKSKKNFYKFKCPSCNMVVHAKLNTNLLCGLCKVKFEFNDILAEENN